MRNHTIKEYFYKDTPNALYAEALERFVHSYGIPEGDALDVYHQWSSSAAITILSEAHDEMVFNGDSVHISGIPFYCPDISDVNTAIFYIITLNSNFIATSVKDEFYQYAWSNAFLHAALAHLKSKTMHTNIYGPGYDGTDPVDMKKIAQMLDFTKAGAVINDSGVIDPPMSIAGFYFLTNRLYLPSLLDDKSNDDRLHGDKLLDDRLLDDRLLSDRLLDDRLLNDRLLDCRFCIGNRKYCHLCY